MTTDIRQDGCRGIEARRECGNAFQLRPGMSFEEWSVLGSRLAHVSSASAWALGDWLLFGQHNFAGRYRVALRETNLDYQTLRNYAWVAGRFRASRRRAGLSFQHHAEVASMTEPEHELWLSRAEAGCWSRNELRRRVAMHRSSPHPVGSSPVVMRFEVAPEEERRWRQAAATKQLPLQDWLRAVADDAANHELADAGPSLADHLALVPERSSASHG